MKIGICGGMFLIFLTLKLVGIIYWSWLWITAPIWGPLAMWLIVIAWLVISIGLEKSNSKLKRK